MNLPTERQCLNYFVQYKVPQNIFNHCNKVREVAVSLARKINEQGGSLNIELINCAAFLHDLFKMVSLESLDNNRFHQVTYTDEEKAMWNLLRVKYPQMKEHEAAYSFFKEEYPELALTLFRSNDFKIKDKTAEEWLIHYADWRVYKNEVVTLNQRMDYLKQVYPREKGLWEQDLKKIQFYEEQLFSQIKEDLILLFKN